MCLALAFGAAALTAAALGGCSGSDVSGPVDWWHQLEGGRIAETRPAPPNADAPYPGLSEVPSRPVAIDAANRGRIASQLASDRANARYATEIAPVPAIGPRPAQPTPTDSPNAAFQAANAPAAPATPPAVAQPEPGSAAPPTGSGPGPSAPAASPPAQASPALAGPVASAPLPAIPDAPPAPPSFAGVPATAPTTPPVAPPPKPAAVVPPKPGSPVLVAFSPGGATLPEGTPPLLQALANSRGGRDIAVVGYGEAASSAPADQAAAFTLALARARAIAGALSRLGVPPSALEVSAEALGHGGAARIAG